MWMHTGIKVIVLDYDHMHSHLYTDCKIVVSRKPLGVGFMVLYESTIPRIVYVQGKVRPAILYMYMYMYVVIEQYECNIGIDKYASSTMAVLHERTNDCFSSMKMAW